MIKNEEEYSRVLEVYLSADTRRWHNKPKIPVQSVADHSFKMILLAIALHPNPSSNLLQAIALHDIGESQSGDFPHETKKRFNVLKEIDEIVRDEVLEELLLPNPLLTEDEKLWLRYLDQLEVIAFLETMVDNPNPQSYDVYENTMAGVLELEKQLQARGYLLEPDNQVH